MCYIDYIDFARYNFTLSDGLPHNVPLSPLDCTAAEATRFILMSAEVTKVEPPGPGDGELPITHFKDVSRSLNQLWNTNHGQVLFNGTYNLIIFILTLGPATSC